MKRLLIPLLLIAVLFGLSPFSAAASSYFNARAYALGGAYTGIVDDYTAIYFNPAGLAHTGFIGVGLGAGGGITGDDIAPLTSYIRMFINDDINWQTILENLTEEDSLNGDYGGFAGIRVGTLGFGVGMQGKGLMELDNGTARVDAENITTYNLAYAHRVLEPFANIGAISVGVNLKYLQGHRVQYSLDDDWDAEQHLEHLESGFGADLGLMFKLSDIINLGVKVENIYNSAEWADEAFPMRYNVGAGIILPFVGTMASVDIGNRPNDTGTIMRAGLEQSLFFNLISLRGGLVLDGSVDRMYTGGLGISLGPVKADLAVGTPDFSLSSISAVLGIRANF